MNAGVQRFRAVNGKFGKRQQYAVGGARPQAGAVGQFQRALEANAATGGFGSTAPSSVSSAASSGSIPAGAVAKKTNSALMASILDCDVDQHWLEQALGLGRGQPDQEATLAAV